ncbi:hypothetical protein ACROYT_G002400 [Oculina patagonica]
MKGIFIFALVVLLVPNETFCRLQEKVSLVPNLPDPTVAPKQHSVDRCCVKRRFYRNGRFVFKCRSEHPDCFAKSDPGSPLFGLCKSEVNSKNVVVGCQCAAKI